MEPKLETIRAALRDRSRIEPQPATPRHAAVAVILRPEGTDAEVLLIRRAVRPGDPWSGHIAFPGGKVEPPDRDLRATAERETHEEVGLDLGPHEYLGFLDEVPATARGARTGIMISPQVFRVAGPTPLSPSPDEVADVFWVSLGKMGRGDLDTHKRLERSGQNLVLPAFGVGEHLVWGLTHHMLRELMSLCR